MVQVLDRVFLGQNEGQLGYWVLGPLGYYFVPMATEQIAALSKRTLFITPSQVTGTIIAYWYSVSNTKRNWGSQAQVDEGFDIMVDAKYSSLNSQHTRMDVIIYKPNGATITANDDDLWPYDAPNTIIHFRIRGPLGTSFKIDVAGTWYAELQYVWVK